MLCARPADLLVAVSDGRELFINPNFAAKVLGIAIPRRYLPAPTG
jgi:hypothetical protein